MFLKGQNCLLYIVDILKLCQISDPIRKYIKKKKQKLSKNEGFVTIISGQFFHFFRIKKLQRLIKANFNRIPPGNDMPAPSRIA